MDATQLAQDVAEGRVTAQQKWCATLSASLEDLARHPEWHAVVQSAIVAWLSLDPVAWCTLTQALSRHPTLHLLLTDQKVILCHPLDFINQAHEADRSWQS